jgi:hypothetical protein
MAREGLLEPLEGLLYGGMSRVNMLRPLQESYLNATMLVASQPATRPSFERKANVLEHSSLYPYAV